MTTTPTTITTMYRYSTHTSIESYMVARAEGHGEVMFAYDASLGQRGNHEEVAKAMAKKCGFDCQFAGGDCGACWHWVPLTDDTRVIGRGGWSGRRRR